MKIFGKTPTFFWQILSGQVLLLLLILILGFGWLSFDTKDVQRRNVVHLLDSHLKLLGNEFVSYFEQNDSAHAQKALLKSAEIVGARFTAISLDGKVLADSEINSELAENHSTRPEVVDALAHGHGERERYSFSTGRQTFYVASLIQGNNRNVGILRAAFDTEKFKADRSALRSRILIGILSLFALVFLGVLYLSHQWVEPMHEIQKMARKIGTGDLTGRIRMGENVSLEFKQLAHALNRTCEALGNRIQLVQRKKQEQEEVFAAMVEGVLVLDQDLKILQINDSAARIFGIEVQNVVGQSVFEVFRSSDLFELIERTRAASHAIEVEFELEGLGETRYLHSHGSTMRDENGIPRGHLFVINDITKLKRLESHRRDFVSNVSHELKTPLTAIQGFVETLLDQPNHPAEVKNYLEVIQRQSGRLGAIIDDLLSLSRIEAESDGQQIERSNHHVHSVIQSAVEACSHRVKEKQLEIRVDCSKDLIAKFNAPLLEQALVNLIDNAIKYSEASRAIEVKAHREGGFCVFDVVDHGVGIPLEHLPRIFERFYRVDKARSRKVGGTGLGLAIVKHIALAHGGSVSVSSEVGRGSVFSLRISAT